MVGTPSHGARTVGYFWILRLGSYGDVAVRRAEGAGISLPSRRFSEAINALRRTCCQGGGYPFPLPAAPAPVI
jgi:hypothetical protein